MLLILVRLRELIIDVFFVFLAVMFLVAVGSILYVGYQSARDELPKIGHYNQGPQDPEANH